jgi:hypothetical protein
MGTKEIIGEISRDRRGFAVISYIKGCQSFLLYTKKGYYRGGDYHNAKQLFVILKGKVDFTIKETNIEKIFVLNEGDVRAVKPGDPHMIRALEDCVILEVSMGGKERITSYYEPYRSIVKAGNEAAGSFRQQKNK